MTVINYNSGKILVGDTVTRLGVISDTHLYSWPEGLLAHVDACFNGVEVILHAGDIVNPLLLDSLSAPVIAVCGNSDSALVAASLPAKRVINIAGWRIGITHGYGDAEDLAARVRRQFTDVDAIVFGHSHVASSGAEGGVFMFNPGSLTRPRDGAPSLGILELGKTIVGTIIRL